MAGGIARASALLASGTLVSRILGFISGVVLAQTLGSYGTGANTNAELTGSGERSTLTPLSGLPDGVTAEQVE